MSNDSAIAVNSLRHYYGNHPGLDGISFDVQRGEIFGFLGPNGGGKSTLFRILSTLIRPSQGEVRICSMDPDQDVTAIRRKIGVVFQSNSLDRVLTVWENLRTQASLFGLKGQALWKKCDELLKRFGMMGSKNQRVSELSGGQRRRLEIIKAMLHNPEILLLDEPSSGLDPAVRIELWNILTEIRSRDNVTVVLTTHFMEEADRCDRLAILNRGKIVASGSPVALRQAIGGDVVTIHSSAPDQIYRVMETDFHLRPALLNGMVRVEMQDGIQELPKILHRFNGQIDSVTVGKPTLEDVFVHHTGQPWNETDE